MAEPQDKSRDANSGKLQGAIQRFLKLKENGELEGIQKSDVSDFSAYSVGRKLRKLESFKEVVKAGKGCGDLTMVDLKLSHKRLAYLFCSKKSPPEYIGPFIDKEHQWVPLPRKGGKN